jgi:hypothetical protein
MRDPPECLRELFALLLLAISCAATGLGDEPADSLTSVTTAPALTTVAPAASPFEVLEHDVGGDAEIALPSVTWPAVPMPGVDAAMPTDTMQWMIDQAVEAKLAGIPRPRYLSASDFVPPKGLLLYSERPHSRDFPFALSISGFMQLRWFEFARSATEWTDATGLIRPINNINTFNINRFLISLNGHVVDERLFYNFSFFGTSNVGVRSGVVPIGMAGWKFSDAAALGVGVTLIPGTREWVDQSPWTLGIDRSMANTFFRPGFSPGAQVAGDLAENTLHYRAGVWNAIDGGQAGVLRRGTSMAFAGNTWWEPLAPWGFGQGDMEHHDEGALRLGCSGVYAETYALIIPGINPEDTITRLSDGTPLADPGALGTGSRVDQYRFNLASIDAGWKRAGWAVNFEYYFRLLDNFKGQGPFDRSSIFDQGGMAYLSWCFVPRRHEVYARSSVVTGPFGTGQEYGGGWNWYLKESRQGRLTIEALHMNNNPAQNFLYPYRAGYTGTAIQTQLVVAF